MKNRHDTIMTGAFIGEDITNAARVMRDQQCQQMSRSNPDTSAHRMLWRPVDEFSCV